MRCLITGATGFVGRHLATALRAAGHEVSGLARRPASQDIPIHAVDLNDAAATTAILRHVQPQWLFHLAGYADNGKSFSEPALAWAGNVDATRSLYDAVGQAGLQPRILYVSSGLVYGDAGPGEHVFTESDPLQPASPYAESKVAAEQLSRDRTLDIVCVRPFNQIGPGQSANYAAARFASQIVAVERGQADHIVVGDLSARRDMTDVRDMVRAYIRLLEVGQAGEVYNAGSGRTYQIQEVLDRLIAIAGVSVKVEQKLDPNRKADTAVSRVDIRKLCAATGWTPTYSLEQSLADMLVDVRGNLSQ
jgi:GDP-4-dehydro-6-deoxy-D-mannose reductase